MSLALQKGERIGFFQSSAKSRLQSLDAVADLLQSCGIKVLSPEGDILRHAARIHDPSSARIIAEWSRRERISAICYEWNLDPEEGLRRLASLIELLQAEGLVLGSGAPIRLFFFAGSPSTCDLVRKRFPFVSGLFRGDETAAEILVILGLQGNSVPASMAADIGYDEDRMSFGRELIAKGDWQAVRGVDHSDYPRFGLRGESLISRLDHARRRNLPPLMRADLSLPPSSRVDDFSISERGISRLAKGGLLDIVTLATSDYWGEPQYENRGSRSSFGAFLRDSPEALSRMRELALPMLARSDSGNDDLVGTAKMFEERLDNAWHSSAFWWSSRLDGGGPHEVSGNLKLQFEALAFIAGNGKPLELDAPRHFALWGSDDTSYVVSGWLAARAAKESGVRDLVLSIALNTPKITWGVNDLAKAKALLQLVRELEDGDFKVHPQPRAGSDYFSSDSEIAMVQLAAVAALMDDIEPWDARSPEIIHVSDRAAGKGIADIGDIEDAVRITRSAISEWRRLRAEGLVDDLSRRGTVLRRTSDLLAEARIVIAAIGENVTALFSPGGMHKILASGFLPLPWLPEFHSEFPDAPKWRTGLVEGAVKVIDAERIVIPADLRMRMTVEANGGPGSRD
ncbi:MAG TPA: hypothetical protein VMV83_00945 [Rectinemataceae bacterium]|nr:hypothetical protein [Rectinemataceae bacterium]